MHYSRQTYERGVIGVPKAGKGDPKVHETVPKVRRKKRKQARQDRMWTTPTLSTGILDLE